MATALEIITQAYAEYNVVQEGGTLPSSFATSGLTRLQQMLDTWSAQGINIFTITTLSAASTGVGSYTFGSAGTFAATRYPDITGMRMRSGTVDYVIPRGSQADYAAFPLKTVQAFVPAFYYYDQGFPTGTVYLAGIPAGASTLFADVYAALTSPSTTGATVSFPLAYTEALVYNLALRLASSLGQEPAPTTREQARDALTVLQALNARIPVLQMPAGVQGAHQDGVDVNWYRDGGLAT